MFTTNQRGLTLQDRHASIAAACVIQYSCCAGEITLRARSTAAIARDMIRNNNHDCGPGGPDTSDELLDPTHVRFPLLFDRVERRSMEQQGQMGIDVVIFK